jgi:hypothetical protein
MKKSSASPDTRFKQQHKDSQIFDSSKHRPQLETIKSFFEIAPASRFMCAVTTGIPIQNICRLAGMLFDAGDIAVVKYDRCAITRQMVQFLSCDRSLFPEIPVQLDLFDSLKNSQVLPDAKERKHSPVVIALLSLPILSRHYLNLNVEGEMAL